VHWHLFWTDTAGTLANSNWLWAFYNWTKMPQFRDVTLPILFWRSLVTVFVPGEHWYNPALWTMKMEFWGSMGLYFSYCLLSRGFASRGGGMLAALIATAALWNVQLLASFAFGIVLFEAVCCCVGSRRHGWPLWREQPHRPRSCCWQPACSWAEYPMTSTSPPAASMRGFIAHCRRGSE